LLEDRTQQLLRSGMPLLRGIDQAPFSFLDIADLVGELTLDELEFWIAFGHVHVPFSSNTHQEETMFQQNLLHIGDPTSPEHRSVSLGCCGPVVRVAPDAGYRIADGEEGVNG
jgi:hypothetical protein